MLQNYARKYTIPIDEIEFDFEIGESNNPGAIEVHPEDGSYIHGLYLEGAKWCYKGKSLTESDPKVLFVKFPVIWLKPAHRSKIISRLCYDSPVYKTSSRRGVLSTTGHSSNFVMWIKVPSSEHQRKWIKRGVALLTQLDY